MPPSDHLRTTRRSGPTRFWRWLSCFCALIACNGSKTEMTPDTDWIWIGHHEPSRRSGRRCAWPVLSSAECEQPEDDLDAAFDHAGDRRHDDRQRGARKTLGVRAPTDNLGNAPYQQLDTAHPYTRYGSSGTAVYAFPSLVGGADHKVTTTTSSDDELTLAAVEVINATHVEAVAWREALEAPLTSASVTTTGPATLVAFWWGDAGVDKNKTATPNNGFVVVDSILAVGRARAVCGRGQERARGRNLRRDVDGDARTRRAAVAGRGPIGELFAQLLPPGAAIATLAIEGAEPTLYAGRNPPSHALSRSAAASSRSAASARVARSPSLAASLSRYRRGMAARRSGRRVLRAASRTPTSSPRRPSCQSTRHSRSESTSSQWPMPRAHPACSRPWRPPTSKRDTRRFRRSRYPRSCSRRRRVSTSAYTHWGVTSSTSPTSSWRSIRRAGSPSSRSGLRGRRRASAARQLRMHRCTGRDRRRQAHVAAAATRDRVATPRGSFAIAAAGIPPVTSSSRNLPRNHRVRSTITRNTSSIAVLIAALPSRIWSARAIASNVASPPRCGSHAGGIRSGPDQAASRTCDGEAVRAVDGCALATSCRQGRSVRSVALQPRSP